MPARLLVRTLILAVVLTTPRLLAAQALFIPVPDRADHVHDPVRNILYITAGTDVLRYDLGRRAFLEPFRLGGVLRGIAISPDGHTLAIADASYSGSGNQGHLWIHVVDLRAERFEQVFFPRERNEGGAFSVAFGADGAIFLTSSFLGSGWTPLRRYDPATHATTFLPVRGAGFFGGVSGRTMLSASADGRVIGFAEPSSSDGPWGAYRIADARFVYYDSSSAVPGTNTFNFSIAASRTGDQFAVLSADRITVLRPDGGVVLRRRSSVQSGTPEVRGAAYHPTADVLFVAIRGANEIWSLDAHTLAPMGTLGVSAGFSLNKRFGAILPYDEGRMTLSRDGAWIFASVAGGVSAVPVSTVLEETAAAIAYAGPWSAYECDGCANGALRFADRTMARATVSFTGRAVQWVTASGPMLGKANVYVDGVFRMTVDLYSPMLTFQTRHDLRDLGPGPHTVTIEVAGQKHPSASGYYVVVDAFQVF